MTRAARRTDLQLQSAVIDELRWTPSVNAAHIDVAVDDGTATLSGEVATYPETLLAVKAALRVRGVLAVAQEIAVRGRWAAATDTQIARHAGEALSRAVNVPDTVKATVHDQALTLSGSVAWQYEREAACRAVNYIPGVTMVVNAISLRPSVAASSIKTDIKEALMRNASIEGQNITVTTDTRGVVTLEGAVRSAAESRQAEKSGWSAAGVTAVNNQLRIES